MGARIRSGGFIRRALAVALGACAGLGLVELSWSVLRNLVEPEVKNFVLIGADAPGSALLNTGSTFRYRPDATIHTAAYYSVADGAAAKEFEYRFRTNNLGLVQSTDIEPRTPSVLILGDSFAEGHGAEPWFEGFAPSVRAAGYQPINGALTGTGFQQWMLLHDDLLSRGIVVTKVIVVLISDDYVRDVWNYQPDHMRCLSDYRACAGDEGYYQMPPDHARSAFLDRISQHDPDWSRPRRWFPATAAAFQTVDWLARALSEQVHRFRHGSAAAEANRRAAPIRQLAARYGTSLIFVHLPTRPELRAGMESSGLIARELILQTRAKYFDGFARCGMTGSDFYVYDHHPNAAGYSKIAACVRDAAAEISATAGR